jgi:hypothetical protein
LKNIKPSVYQALQNDVTLISLLGGIVKASPTVTYQRIYQLMAPNAQEFPRLVFWEMDNVGATYADDTEKNSEITIQIDIYTINQSTSVIAGEIDIVMKGLGFFRNASTDQYNDDNDTQINEKHMRYAIFAESEE